MHFHQFLGTLCTSSFYNLRTNKVGWAGGTSSGAGGRKGQTTPTLSPTAYTPFLPPQPTLLLCSVRTHVCICTHHYLLLPLHHLFSFFSSSGQTMTLPLEGHLFSLALRSTTKQVIMYIYISEERKSIYVSYWAAHSRETKRQGGQDAYGHAKRLPWVNM